MSRHEQSGVVDTADPSVGQLLMTLSEQTSRLVRDELALAQVELRSTVRHAGTGVGLFSAAGVLAVLGAGALVATAVIALALILPLWLSALIVTVVLFAAAAAAALLGRNQVQQASPVPERTIENVKQDVHAVQEARRP